jgi:hypothetical protein
MWNVRLDSEKIWFASCASIFLDYITTTAVMAKHAPPKITAEDISILSRCSTPGLLLILVSIS